MTHSYFLRSSKKSGDELHEININSNLIHRRKRRSNKKKKQQSLDISATDEKEKSSDQPKNIITEQQNQTVPAENVDRFISLQTDKNINQCTQNVCQKPCKLLSCDSNVCELRSETPNEEHEDNSSTTFDKNSETNVSFNKLDSLCEKPKKSEAESTQATETLSESSDGSVKYEILSQSGDYNLPCDEENSNNDTDCTNFKMPATPDSSSLCLRSPIPNMMLPTFKGLTPYLSFLETKQVAPCTPIPHYLNGLLMTPTRQFNYSPAVTPLTANLPGNLLEDISTPNVMQALEASTLEGNTPDILQLIDLGNKDEEENSATSTCSEQPSTTQEDPLVTKTKSCPFAEKQPFRRPHSLGRHYKKMPEDVEQAARKDQELKTQSNIKRRLRPKCAAAKPKLI